MKKLVSVVVAVLLLSSTLWAVENSLTFGPLAQSPTFRSRVIYIIVQQAPVVQVEAVAYTPPVGDTHTSTAACHTKRAALGASVAANPDTFAPVFASHLTTNVNVTGGGALTGTLAAGTLDTPATDGALLAAVAAIWSTIAGCVNNP